MPFLNNGFNRLMAAQDARPPVKLYINPVGEPPSISEPIVHLIIVTVKASTGEYTSNATSANIFERPSFTGTPAKTGGISDSA